MGGEEVNEMFIMSQVFVVVFQKEKLTKEELLMKEELCRCIAARARWYRSVLQKEIEKNEAQGTSGEST